MKDKPKSVSSGRDWPEQDVFVGMVSCGNTQADQEDTEESDGHSKNGDTWMVSQAKLISMTEINAMKEKPFGIISASSDFSSCHGQLVGGTRRGSVLCRWQSSGGPPSKGIMKDWLKRSRVHENGLRLNCTKCHFGVQEIIFIGDKMSARVIEPDEREINCHILIQLC